MGKWKVTSILLVLLAVAGCTQEQGDKIDKGMADANAIGDALQEITEGPVGDMLPSGVKSTMQVLGVAAATALGIWQQMRAKVVKQTASAVLAGIERLPRERKKETKAAVKAEMDERNIYTKANAVVDKLKTS